MCYCWRAADVSNRTLATCHAHHAKRPQNGPFLTAGGCTCPSWHAGHSNLPAEVRLGSASNILLHPNTHTTYSRTHRPVNLPLCWVKPQNHTARQHPTSTNIINYQLERLKMLTFAEALPDAMFFQESPSRDDRVVDPSLCALHAHICHQYSVYHVTIVTPYRNGRAASQWQSLE